MGFYMMTFVLKVKQTETNEYKSMNNIYGKYDFKTTCLMIKVFYANRDRQRDVCLTAYISSNCVQPEASRNFEIRMAYVW